MRPGQAFADTAIPIQSVSRTSPEVAPWLLLTGRVQVPLLIFLPHTAILEKEIWYEFLLVQIISAQITFSET